MHGGYSSYYPNSGGYLYEPFKVTILILTPTCQRRIVSCPSRVSMCARFYRASIVSCCEADRCDAIHYSFVVSCTPVRVRGRESVGLNDSVNDVLSTQILLRVVGSGPGDSPICYIGYG